MAFSSDITHLPRVFDPLTTPPIQGLPDDLSRLVQAAASASPYLARLIEREPDIPAALVEGSVEALFQTTLAAVSEDVVDPARHLRRLKGRAALLTALADLSGVWPLDRVTMALSQFADAVVDATLKDLVRTAVERGALPETRAPAGGLFAIAMGKLGALELNYSSDIDLILLFDEAVYPKAAYADIRATLVRVAKELVRRLSAQTGDGYVFRVDLRLRPDASVTPLVIGMEAAERYYEAEGRSWERAAMIKARAVAGDTGAAARFLEALRPFVWRRSLDFATIEDVADMRRRIRHHRGLNGPLSLSGHNIKLGRGGIREIEFLAQTLQLIHGGRDPGLRARATRAALSALANRGLITREAASTLDTAYVAHRTLENRLQMLNDAQTHTVPQAPEARARLAALYGAEDVEAFEDSALTHLKRVEAVSTTLFAPEPSLADRQSPWAGFADAAAAEARARHWRRLPALRSGRATEFFRRIEPRIAARLGEALSPDDALLSFDSFLRRLPAGVQVFALFDANPTLLELMVDLCSRAPRLAEHLGQRPDVLDVVLAPGFFDLPAGADHLATELEADLREIGDYERMLDRIRIWAREQQFRVGVQLLQGIATAEEARRAYADIADASLRT
ncbi:MAG: glutamine-synthetase adenylyltransferase, partial [Pseudomonadota bacterium]